MAYYYLLPPPPFFPFSAKTRFSQQGVPVGTHMYIIFKTMEYYMRALKAPPKCTWTWRPEAGVRLVCPGINIHPTTGRESFDGLSRPAGGYITA